MMGLGARQAIFDYENGKGLAYGYRARRAALFKSFVATHYAGVQRLSIVDFGGTETFWKSVGLDYLSEIGASVTLVNLTAPDVERRDIFTAVAGDARSFTAKAPYDICFSNSCIEHVGQVAEMIRFRDAVRGAARGYFIQTPNFWFPIEPHFVMPGFHWLPKSAQAWLIRHVQMGHFPKVSSRLDSYALAESCHLLTPRVFAELFDDAEIARERAYGLTKSLIAMRGPV
ncbi:hypothetical protein [Pseudoroseicyclus sp. CXY001]|uniref:hypothetical protein n=1 Tax=Pseudoroseicyclus sp. CXY001 TaxID=3242492 RepID=UPI00358DBC67